VEKVDFLLIRTDVVGPILGKGVELSSVVIDGVVSLLKIQTLLQLGAEHIHR
jgi:hypothetical protein